MRILALCGLCLTVEAALAQDVFSDRVAHPLAHDASHVVYPGMIEPARSVDVRSPVSSKIIKVFTQPGDRVARGQMLAALDPGPIEVVVRQWDQAVERAQAGVARAQEQVKSAEQLAKLAAGALADLRMEEVRKFQDVGDKAHSACQKLALSNSYWKSQGDFRTARETLQQTLILCKSRPPGSDPLAQAQRLAQALNKIPAGPVPLDKDCAADVARLKEILDRLMLLCRAGTPQGRAALQAESALAETVLKTAEEGRTQARQALEQIKISAPIDGLVQQIVKVGSTVAAGEPMATIIQVDIVRVAFAVNESCYLRYQELIKRKQHPDIPIALGRKDNKDFPFPGKIQFVDNHIDPRKGLADLRAEFDNTKGKLTELLLAADKDKRAVRIRITLSEPHKVVLVPWQIIQTNRDGSQSVFVVKERKLQVRAVKLGGQVGGMQIVADGLTPEDLVILGSARRNLKDQTISPEDFATDVRHLRAGAAVTPVLVVLPQPR